MSVPQQGPALGVCYYPEQWPEEKWAQDAARMADLGLTWVRIAEFAWSRIEPAPGHFEWDWLDRAVETLGRAGLNVIMSTPTAAPPKWLVDLCPDILPVDARGVVRKFGARRHYCFSSGRYRTEAVRICRAMAERYGANTHVKAWQIDNEYGDHDTIHSYSDAALGAFRHWLAARYGTIAALNTAWGTSFWSMTYSTFEQIELPNNLVEEPTPTQLMDYFRFSSDQVRVFNKAQVDVLRPLSPDRPITHNYMSQHTAFDHYDVGQDLDIASWDVYPLGGLVHGRLPEAEKARYLRVGDPDQISFSHDLYRTVGKGRVWVMEQQPGPVSWASYNQAPADGMVRLWTWLAYAHGVEMVSYFRWRQVPFAQEQYHAAILLPDDTPDQAFEEIAQVQAERALVPALGPRPAARVALVLDYASRWTTKALPQGADYPAHHIALDWYAALRRHGVDVDIIGQHSDVSPYRLVIAPDLVIADDAFLHRLQQAKTKVLFGPRSGSKTRDMHIPPGLAGAPLAPLINLKITRVESLPPYHAETILFGNGAGLSGRWRETIVSPERVLATYEGQYRDKGPALIGTEKCRYITTLPDRVLLNRIMCETLNWADVPHLTDLGDVRIARRGKIGFAFNYGASEVSLPTIEGAKLLLGDWQIPPVGVTIWQDPPEA